MNKVPAIENQIVSLLKKGDQQAVALIYDHYGAVLFGLCVRMMGSKEEAEEVFQESMIKIWKKAQSYDSEKARLYTWMMNVTRNTCIDQIRKEDRKPEIQAVEKNVTKVEAVHQTTDSVDHIGLKKELKNLRPEDRSVIELSYLEGYTQDEIAQKLNIPLGTVKSRARKAIKELRRLLAKDIGS